MCDAQFVMMAQENKTPYHTKRIPLLFHVVSFSLQVLVKLVVNYRIARFFLGQSLGRFGAMVSTRPTKILLTHRCLVPKSDIECSFHD